MDKDALLKKLLYKTLSELHLVLEDFEYGRYPIEYSFVFEEVMFMKLLDMDKLKDSYLNATTQYFLNNDYTTRTFSKL